MCFCSIIWFCFIFLVIGLNDKDLEWKEKIIPIGHFTLPSAMTWISLDIFKPIIMSKCCDVLSLVERFNKW